MSSRVDERTLNIRQRELRQTLRDVWGDLVREFTELLDVQELPDGQILPPANDVDLGTFSAKEMIRRGIREQKLREYLRVFETVGRISFDDYGNILRGPHFDDPYL